MRVCALAAFVSAMFSPAAAAVYTAAGGQIVFETSDTPVDILLSLTCNVYPYEDRFTADGVDLCERGPLVPPTTTLIPLTLHGVGNFVSYFGHPASNGPSDDQAFNLYAVSSALDDLQFPGPLRFSCNAQVSGAPICDTGFAWELFLFFIDEDGEQFTEITHLVQDWMPVAVPAPFAGLLFLTGLSALSVTARRSAQRRQLHSAARR
jgi:hypothetical protein